MLVLIRKIICYILSTLIFVSVQFFGAGNEKIDSLDSVTMIEDGFYTMNYTYNYDVDEMLDEGVSSHVQLIFKGLCDAAFGGIKGLGCTTFNCVTPGGDYILGRNFDYTESDYMLVWTDPEDGYASISSVALIFNGYDSDFTPQSKENRALTLLAPYAPLDGINEKGLSIAILELEKTPVFQTTEKVDLTTTTIVRAVLDKAASVDEAVEIFNSYDLRDMLLGGCTYHYQIADAYGNSVVVEYVDGKMNLVYPEKNESNAVDYIVAANYYLTEGVDDPDGMGYERADTVYAALNATRGISTQKNAMQILKSVSMKDESLHGYICSTLWSAVYNMNDLTADICVNNNYERVYQFSINQPQIILN